MLHLSSKYLGFSWLGTFCRQQLRVFTNQYLWTSSDLFEKHFTFIRIPCVILIKNKILRNNFLFYFIIKQRRAVLLRDIKG